MFSQQPLFPSFSEIGFENEKLFIFKRAAVPGRYLAFNLPAAVEPTSSVLALQTPMFHL